MIRQTRFIFTLLLTFKYTSVALSIGFNNIPFCRKYYAVQKENHENHGIFHAFQRRLTYDHRTHYILLEVKGHLINHYIYIGSLLERGEEVHLNITVTLFWNKVVWSPNSSSAISSGNAGNAGKLGSGDKKLILLLHFY